MALLYQQIQALNPVAFRRACGVKRKTFQAAKAPETRLSRVRGTRWRLPLTRLSLNK